MAESSMIEKRMVYTKDGPNPAEPFEGAEGYEILIDHTPVQFRFNHNGLISTITRTVAETLEKRGEGHIVTQRPEL